MKSFSRFTEFIEAVISDESADSNKVSILDIVKPMSVLFFTSFLYFIPVVVLRLTTGLPSITVCGAFSSVAGLITIIWYRHKSFRFKNLYCNIAYIFSILFLIIFSIACLAKCLGYI